ncbi:hypothetical protein IE4872_PD01176 (plasmid) [Rhizobium gallicum]|uniref:Uncharacterized protein n=1 Tax=Rhizobium gallicum TaxID=56730 RepID=A0A1L5NUW6_9HYPH|nr:hypothetical protein IE4872_PD01176 [Rhizobium gallicum]
MKITGVGIENVFIHRALESGKSSSATMQFSRECAALLPFPSFVHRIFQRAQPQC